MKPNKNKLQAKSSRVEAAAATGAIAGAAAGAIAGPAGAIAGGLVGAVAGAAAGAAIADDATRRHAHAAELDREVGVTEGNLGAASPDQPPARVGAYSAGSAGAAGSSATPCEGPIQEVDD
jgi:hypothetical protein